MNILMLSQETAAHQTKSTMKKHSHSKGRAARANWKASHQKICNLLYFTTVFAVVTAGAAGWKPAENVIATPWTAEVKPGNVLPEYPRPQMERAKWVNLNGLWEYAIAGKEETRPDKFDGQIMVPFPVESALSGVKRPLLPEQRLWYRRVFTTPHFKGRLLLHFDAVDWRAEVWLNGKSIGKHEGGYEPFTFDITDTLKSAGPQELVVAVWDPTEDGGVPRGKQSLKPSAIFYTAVSGIWQTVWLEPVPAAHITALKMIPDVDGKKLRLTVQVDGADPSGGEQFTAKATLAGHTVGRIEGKAGQEIELPLAELKPWSPDSPVLYDLRVTLNSGDVVKSYFGMRKIEVRKNPAGYAHIYLNNAPIFMIGPLDQGWWPDGLYTAPSDKALKYDIEMMRKLGYNMVRKHVKVEPARWYYWADKLGLMVWQDMPSILSKSMIVPKGATQDGELPAEIAADYERELKALLATHVNSPSIITWVPFNEGWGQHDTKNIIRLVKEIDPSRLVDGPSGWQDFGIGDMIDRHDYPGPSMNPVLPDRASVLGEFGALGMSVEGHRWTDHKNWTWKYTDLDQMQTAYENLMARLKPLVIQGLSAAVYTQTTDCEGEQNGLMTYDRKVLKFNLDRLAALHRELIEAGK